MVRRAPRFGRCEVPDAWIEGFDKAKDSRRQGDGRKDVRAEERREKDGPPTRTGALTAQFSTIR